MTDAALQDRPGVPFTLAAIGAGYRIGLPFLLSSALTGMVMGVTYRELGLDATQAILLSAALYSGTAQAVTALMLVATPMPLAAMLLAVFGINARYLVMSAHLRRLFPDVGNRRMLPSLFMLVDAAWMITVVKAEEGRRDAGFMLGSGLAMYTGWVSGTAIGHSAHLAPSGPLAAAAAFLPLGFILSMVPSQWKGRKTFLPWLVTAAATAGALLLVPGTWAALIGAAAGTVTAVMGEKV